MDVTVVIPAGPPSHWHSLVRAVAAARSQTRRPAEIIVVVDQETAYFRRIRRDLAGVTVLENDRGPGGSRDTGAYYAVTELIAFLADDVIAGPDWLARLAEALRDPAVVGAGGGLRPDWRDGRPRWLADELTWTLVPTARPAGMMVRRSVFRQVGGFGRRAAELPLRMRSLAGGRWRHVPDAVLRHEVPGHAASFPAYLRRCFAEGRPALRPMPRAVLGNLRAALRGRGVDHALRACGALAGMAAAGAGVMTARRPVSAGR
ncbi:glycosyltransferase family A protein [Actinoplanes subtropicus]|uniref:glycosyltransferase family A protein n=1 Tax=Actinoplanes subtropicus TaxID=543632 RepID=UPI0006892DC3|nr:glycosyltransferase family A protein [Actinoplanes subtropicus]